MKCSFSRLLYPKRLEEARDGSYMIALFKPNEKVLDAQGNRLSSIKVVGHFLPTVAGVKVDMTGHWKKDARYAAPPQDARRGAWSKVPDIRPPPSIRR